MYRGFESHPLRHKEKDIHISGCLFLCAHAFERDSNPERAKSVKKVAGGKFFSFLVRSPVPKPKAWVDKQGSCVADSSHPLRHNKKQSSKDGCFFVLPGGDENPRRFVEAGASKSDIWTNFSYIKRFAFLLLYAIIKSINCKIMVYFTLKARRKHV